MKGLLLLLFPTDCWRANDQGPFRPVVSVQGPVAVNYLVIFTYRLFFRRSWHPCLTCLQTAPHLQYLKYSVGTGDHSIFRTAKLPLLRENSEELSQNETFLVGGREALLYKATLSLNNRVGNGAFALRSRRSQSQCGSHAFCLMLTLAIMTSAQDATLKN